MATPARVLDEVSHLRSLRLQARQAAADAEDIRVLLDGAAIDELLDQHDAGLIGDAEFVARVAPLIG